MRRFFVMCVVCCLACTSVLAQMSDGQVVSYLKEAQSQGKDQTQISTELLNKGVTREQLMRIKNRYESGEEMSSGENATQQERVRASERAGVQTIHPEAISGELDAVNVPVINDNSRRIFGRSIFTNRNLSFEPNVNAATPVNYRLGPGDEVVIDIWGTSENTIRQVISPEGSVTITNLGPLYLSGMTIAEATNYLQGELSKIYSGLQEDASQLKVTLGQLRTIKVNIMGEVAVPGTYRLSSFSTVFHAIYNAGGMSPIGSLRHIQVIRGGKKIATIDVYDYIMRGKTNDDIRLMEDDVILVPAYTALVSITGKVRRPMFYEMATGETIGDLLEYAGGFTGDAYKENIRLIRLSGREKQIYNVDKKNFASFKLEDEDSFSVEAVLNRFENMVEIRGAVYREGLYQLSNEVNSVKQLIRKAEGLRGDAFLNRVQIRREHEDLTHEMIPLNLQGILNGSAPDVTLQRNDVLYIASIHDLQQERSLTIHGAIASPGTYAYAERMTVEDIVLQAGGLLESASTANVSVSRRIKDPKSTTTSQVIGQTYEFDFKDGYLVGGEAFFLEPFDEVYVRLSPAYHAQQNVSVMGEVVFRGTYALTKKNERLTDLIEKAGGLTPDAYIKGARLLRKMTPEELQRRNDMIAMANDSTTDIERTGLNLSTTYPVGIELNKAMESPNSDFNLVLREGDVLFVPELINTVKINGGVMHPNTVSYKKGEKLAYYLNQAGGYTQKAKKRKAYVVHMNGTVSRLKKNDSKSIEPGSEIIIPIKEPKNRSNIAEITTIASATTSMAAVIVALINLLK